MDERETARDRRTLDVAEIVDAWTPAIARQQAIAIVSLIVYAAHAEGAPAPIAARLFEFDPGIDVGVNDLLRLRAVLAPRLIGDSEVGLRMHAALDDLVATVAARQVDRLERTALLDELTAIGNRRAMDRELSAAVGHSVRHATTLAVAMVDLDGLKRVNDTEGHATGDELIRSMARALAANARAGDSVFRIGGDEFLVLFRDSSAADAETLLARVRPQAPSFSAGVAAVPEDGDDVATILRVADARLYAGRGQRERVVVTQVPATERGVRTPRRGRGVLLVPAAAAVAEGVRHRRGIDVRGANLAAWTAVAAAGPIALAGATWRRGLALPRVAAVAGATLASLLIALPLLEHEPAPSPPDLAAPVPTSVPLGGPIDAAPPRPPIPVTEEAPDAEPDAPTPATPTPASPTTASPPSARSAAPAPPPTVLPEIVLIASPPPAAASVEPLVPPVGDDDVVEAADLGPAQPGHRRALARGNPHRPGERGKPHEPGGRGDPHREPHPHRDTPTA